ncbi:MAG: haloalkane dehalogenase [Pseudomonadales bacterium]
MNYQRTPDDRFQNLDGYPFPANYVQVADPDGGELRMHYLDEGPPEGELILCLHGQPTWSYLYRLMIPLFVDAGFRVVAVDFIGFGKSDKPTQRSDYTYARHVAWTSALITKLNLTDITMVCQDWGGLIGLRAATELPERFVRIVTANTGLPDANGVEGGRVQQISDAMRAHYDSLPVHQSAPEMGAAMIGDSSGMGFLHWVKFCAETPALRVSDVVNFSSGGGLSDSQVAAYDAPFPDDGYMAGARQFPSLVPIMPDNPAIASNRDAWKVLENWEKPFLTAFSDSDPVTAGAHVRFQESAPGAKTQKHVTIEGAGHFLQEQAPEALASAVLTFIADNPI